MGVKRFMAALLELSPPVSTGWGAGAAIAKGPGEGTREVMVTGEGTGDEKEGHWGRKETNTRGPGEAG